MSMLALFLFLSLLVDSSTPVVDFKFLNYTKDWSFSTFCDYKYLGIISMCTIESVVIFLLFPLLILLCICNCIKKLLDRCSNRQKDDSVELKIVEVDHTKPNEHNIPNIPINLYDNINNREYYVEQLHPVYNGLYNTKFYN